MANYFVAGVGRVALFKGDDLFADARTLVDSSITIGVTAEDIRGGEGNQLLGRYFHDSSFSLKLTDAMFNLEYLAANTGATIGNGGNAFAYETKTSDASGKVIISEDAQPLVSGGTAYVYARKSSESGAKMEKYAFDSTDKSFTVTGITAATEFCVMYNKAVDGEKITIKSQFIPDTLHAVLTVALYSGDACNTESATKAGEVVIDIPRFQLSGAQDIAMSATGAAQVALDGQALASGCTGCDGEAIYATITKYISGTNWYDDAQGLVVEDLSGITAGDVVDRDVVVYAYYASKAPKKVDIADLTIALTAGTTGLSYASGKITGTAAAGTAILDVNCTAKTALATNKAIVIA